MFDLKENSHKKALHLIRIYGEMSGAEMSRIMGMTPSSLMNILRILSEKGLIEKSGQGDSSSKGGKKPTLWRIAPQAGSIIGLSLNIYGYQLVDVHLSGKIKRQLKKPIASWKQSDFVSRVCACLDEYVNDQKEDVLGIGIALPGVVDTISGKVLYSAEFNLNDVELEAQVSHHFGLPVWIENDANAGSLLSIWYPKNPSDRIESVVYLLFAPQNGNLGVGLLINGKLHRGAYGMAGEYLTRKPDWPQINKGDKTLPDIYKPITYDSFNEYLDLALANDPSANSWAHQLTDLLAENMAHLIALINPEQVVVGGALSMNPEFLETFFYNKVDDILESHLHSAFIKPMIESVRYGEFDRALGASALIIDDLMAH